VLWRCIEEGKGEQSSSVALTHSHWVAVAGAVHKSVCSILEKETAGTSLARARTPQAVKSTVNVG
jgi:hypothetical protein